MNITHTVDNPPPLPDPDLYTYLCAQHGKTMGQNMGQLISKFVANIWDIDINNLTVSHIKRNSCSYF